jgi:hypothetical protein
MIEPFTLPEALSWLTEESRGAVTRKPFEIFERCLQPGDSDLTKQMNMSRHYYIFIDLPVAALTAMIDRLAY